MKIPLPIYDIELIERNGHHFYSNDGGNTYYPGSTGILDILSKPALVPWASKKVADYTIKRLEELSGLFHRYDVSLETDIKRYKKFKEKFIHRAKKQPHISKVESANYGSYAHKHFNEFLINKKKLPDDIVFESFLYWLSKEKLNVFQGDTKIVSLKFGYGGSLDALGFDENGQIFVIDFKTGNSIYDSHAYQVASYCYAYSEVYNLDYIPKGVVIRFGKDKVEYERREINVQPSFDCFLTCLNMYRLSKITPFSSREINKKPKEAINVCT